MNVFAFRSASLQLALYVNLKQKYTINTINRTNSDRCTHGCRFVRIYHISIHNIKYVYGDKSLIKGLTKRTPTARKKTQTHSYGIGFTEHKIMLSMFYCIILPLYYVTRG
jgi:hypothetical protein